MAARKSKMYQLHHFRPMPILLNLYYISISKSITVFVLYCILVQPSGHFSLFSEVFVLIDYYVLKKHIQMAL